MKRTILALGIVALISGPVLAACDSCHGVPIDNNDGTTEVTGFIINTINPSGVIQASNLAQPKRRDVAGAVLLDLEPASAVGEKVELTRTVDENGAKLEQE